MIATEWPWSSRICASVAPARPHPMITKCTTDHAIPRACVHGTGPARRDPGRRRPLNVSSMSPCVGHLRRHQAVARRATGPERPPGADAALKAHRAARVRVGRDVLGRVRTGRDPAHPVDRRVERSSRVAVGRTGRRSRAGHRGGLVPAERARLSVRRRRLRGRDGESRAARRADRRERADGGLCADCRGLDAAVALALSAIVALMNLRGVRESGTAFAAPTYLFVIAIGVMIVVGLARFALGNLPMAASSVLDVAPQSGFETGLMGLAGGFLVLRAFASGCAALTGVEAISNGVPAFRKPKSKNAATTLLWLGLLSTVMMMGILVLSRITHIHFVDNPGLQLSNAGVPVGADYVQDPVIGQLAHAIFAGFPLAFYFVAAVTGLILALAANTAFNGFPVLGSILARDGYLPRQLHTRGDRLAYSNGIIALAAGAMVLVWAFDAQVTRLIQLYIVGVFVSFTLSQLGMVKHWTRLLAEEHDARARAKMMRARAINGFGMVLTFTVLIVVLITKFVHGAWIAILAMVVIFTIMRSIRQHYDSVREELALGTEREAARALPSRVHAIVLISRLHKPTMRAIAYA